MLLSNIDIGDLDCHPAPDDDRPRRAQRACEGAARGVGAPAVAPRAKAGVWGGAPRRT
jgi:hypothetical protein